MLSINFYRSSSPEWTSHLLIGCPRLHLHFMDIFSNAYYVFFKNYLVRIKTNLFNDKMVSDDLEMTENISLAQPGSSDCGGAIQNNFAFRKINI